VAILTDTKGQDQSFVTRRQLLLPLLAAGPS